jgi:hydroxymethylbilane synthase
MTRLTLLSRASDLAVIQARQVAGALQQKAPGLEIVLATRATTGDRETRLALSDAADKGLFTADLSDALAAGEADAVVHSWKDLPIADRTDTVVVATLERADPRDVLLVRREAREKHPATLRVLTSSPRRAWQIDQSLAPLLPWPVQSISSVAVRGNIPTRLRKLAESDGDALVVAKAALDRLLADDAPSEVRDVVRSRIDGCSWMVLPIRDFPTAPAQGALAIEVSKNRPDVVALVEAINHAPTADAVREERRVLCAHGGGCHEAIGVTVLPREYGRIRATRGRIADGSILSEWTLLRTTPEIAPAALDAIWPRRDERGAVVRAPVAGVDVPRADDLWVARSEALPAHTVPGPGQLVWVAGDRTWKKLAARGVWVNGSAEGLGDTETPAVELLAGRRARWRRLTHTNSDAPDALATYVAEPTLPADLGSRTHFFWTSGAAFLKAVAAWPSIRDAEHASGPGRTARTLRSGLGPGGRASIWLDYDEWLRAILR